MPDTRSQPSSWPEASAPGCAPSVPKHFHDPRAPHGRLGDRGGRETGADPVVVVASPCGARRVRRATSRSRCRRRRSGPATPSARRARRSPAHRATCSCSPATRRCSPPSCSPSSSRRTGARERRRRSSAPSRPTRALRAHRPRRRRLGAADRRRHRRDAEEQRDRRDQLLDLRLPLRSALAGARAAAAEERPGRALPHRRDRDPRRGRGEGGGAHRARPARPTASTRASSSRAPRPCCATASTRRTCSRASRSSIRRRRGSSPTVEIEPDVTIHPFTVLRGATRIASGAEIHANTVAIDATSGAHAVDRAVLLPSPRHGPRRVLQGGHLRGDQELTHRRPHEGAAPVVHRRRRDRRGHEHRRRRRSPPTTRTSPGEPKGRTTIGSNVRTGIHNGFVAPVEVGDGAWIAAGSVITKDVPPGRTRGSPGHARRTRRDMQPGSATTELVLPGLEAPEAVTQPQPGHWIERGPQKRLMVFSGRSHPAPRAADRRAARRRARGDRAQHVRERRDLLPLRRVDSRRGRLPRADRLRARRPERDGAAVHDPGGEARVGQADHRGDPALPLRAAGSKGEAARADLGAARRRHAPARRRRPGAHDGPARRPDPGLLHDPGRPHDGAAALRAPLPRSRPDRRGRRLGLARRRPREDGRALRRDARRRLRAHAQDAPRARRRRGDRDHGPRSRQEGGARRRRDHDRRHAAREREGAEGARRRGRLGVRDPRHVLRRRAREVRRRPTSRASSSPTRCRSTRSRSRTR